VVEAIEAPSSDDALIALGRVLARTMDRMSDDGTRPASQQSGGLGMNPRRAIVAAAVVLTLAACGGAAPAHLAAPAA
jgi:hypothetical protein